MVLKAWVSEALHPIKRLVARVIGVGVVLVALESKVYTACTSQVLKSDVITAGTQAFELGVVLLPQLPQRHVCDGISDAFENMHERFEEQR